MRTCSAEWVCIRVVDMWANLTGLWLVFIGKHCSAVSEECEVLQEAKPEENGHV